MKFPKERKRYCPTCKKHTLHKIKHEKNRGKNKTHPLSKGSMVRMRLRGAARGVGNHGKTSRGAMSGWKRWNKKRTKKTDFRYTCMVCKKTHAQSKGLRASKIVFE